MNQNIHEAIVQYFTKVIDLQLEDSSLMASIPAFAPLVSGASLSDSSPHPRRKQM